eukprot:7379783-Prymnesium_polylepis.1
MDDDPFSAITSERRASSAQDRSGSCFARSRDSNNMARTAAKKLHKRTKPASRKTTEVFYASCISMRTQPLTVFVDPNENGAASGAQLPITSVAESRLLAVLGLPADERDQIQGLLTSSTSSVVGGHSLTGSELSF